MSNIRAKLNQGKMAVKNFFYQTFRRHTAEEYSELLTRGLRGKRGLNGQYPWLYMRLFGILFILFAAYLLLVRLMGNQLYVPSVLLYGGIAFLLPFIVLLYELYPLRDFSLLSLFAVLILGGALSGFLCQTLYYFVPNASGWLGSLRVAGIEEICKAVVAVLVIILVRARDPLLGFIIGAAVGAGFSIAEDMGYLFIHTEGWQAVDIPSLVRLFFVRGLTSFCTHVPWSGFIGWAYARRQKPLHDVTFYVMAGLSVGLHMLWNSPMPALPQAIVTAAVVIVVLIIGLAIWDFGRKDAFHKSEQPKVMSPESKVCVKDYRYYHHGANLSFAFFGLLLAVCALVFCGLPVPSGYDTKTFESRTEFVEFAQNGHDLSADWNRPHDNAAEDMEKHYVNGVLTQVVQTEERGGYHYFYYYTVNNDNQYMLLQIMVEVTENHATMRYRYENIYFRGSVYASFFEVNNTLTGYAVDEDGAITAFVYDSSARGNPFPKEYVPIAYVSIGLTVVEIVVYIAFYWKARKLKKLQSQAQTTE